MRYLAGRLGAVRGGDWRYVAEGQAALLWARALVWRRPEGELTARGRGDARAAAASVPATAEERALARRLALGVRRAAAYGVFRPLCLVRAVAINGLMERHGIVGSEVRVGVKWVDGKFEAHAWVEYAGDVLGDEEHHVRAFAELEELRMVGRRP
jgi:hypothetical protein